VVNRLLFTTLIGPCNLTCHGNSVSRALVPLRIRRWPGIILPFGESAVPLLNNEKPHISGVPDLCATVVVFGVVVADLVGVFVVVEIRVVVNTLQRGILQYSNLRLGSVV